MISFSGLFVFSRAKFLCSVLSKVTLSLLLGRILVFEGAKSVSLKFIVFCHTCIVSDALAVSVFEETIRAGLNAGVC